KKFKHPSEFMKLGDKVDCVVLEVDAENKRISLVVKQLEENQWDAFEVVFAVDSVHKGTITSMTDKGAIVALPYGVEGFAPKKHLIKADGSSALTDEQLDFKVLEFNKETRKIIVSHTRIHQEATDEQKKEERKDEKESLKKVQESVSKNTMGDLEGLAKLKKEMEGGN
ncbi:MAG: S1 RNA-binding domain-containing protein, partial [Bacteroidia bacterium]